METETVNLGNSSREIGSKRVSFNALVNAYSFNPEWRFISENVPMQPRKRKSRPIFHVTNNGLQGNHNENLIWSRRILWGLTMMSWRYPRYEAQHVVRDHEVLYVRHQSRRKPFLEQQPLVSEQDFHFGRNARWSSDSHYYLVAAFLRLAAAENVHFGGRKIFYWPLSKKGLEIMHCVGS